MNKTKHPQYPQIRDYVYNLAKEIIQDVCGEQDKLTDTINLLSSGLIDSMGMLEMLATVEKQYNINVPESEFSNFSTVQNIAEIVFKYQKEQAR